MDKKWKPWLEDSDDPPPIKEKASGDYDGPDGPLEKPITEEPEQRADIEKRLAYHSNDEDQSYKVRLDNLIHDVALDWLDDETDEDFIFKTRSKVVKRFMRHIEQNYTKELAYGKPYNFPLGWMEDDSKIMKTLDRWPIISEVMQFLYLRQRSLNAPLMQALQDQNQAWIDGRVYKSDTGKLYPIATFMTNSEFYSDLGKSINTRRGEQPSPRYMIKIVTAFKKANIIMTLGGNKRNGFIVADGYYTPYDDRWIKHLFLKNTPEFKKALQSMTI
jgi:hypothetical protein